MKKAALAALVLFFLVTGFAMAQEVVGDPVEIDPSVVQAIMTGVMGFGVIALVQLIKTFLKVEGVIVSCVISLVVSAVATAIFLVTTPVTGGFTVLKFVVYTIAVWGFANGWFKFKKETGGGV